MREAFPGLLELAPSHSEVLIAERALTERRVLQDEATYQRAFPTSAARSLPLRIPHLLEVHQLFE